MVRSPCADPSSTVLASPRGFGRSTSATPCRGAATADEFMAHFIELGGLQPDERVLDVGCGIGRMARPLAGYLSSEGSYDGFDVNRDGIAWCRRRYRRHANFRFEVADLFNARYNPRGAQRADEYRFPYDD